MALCLRKSKQGLGEETDEDTEREKNNENKQADCCGFTLSFLNRLLWIFFYKVGGGVAAVHAKRTSCTSLQLNSSYNHREKAWDQAILMLIGIITGVPGSVGEALSLFIKWLLTTQGNSKLTAYYSFSH